MKTERPAGARAARRPDRPCGARGSAAVLADAEVSETGETRGARIAPRRCE